MIDMIDSTSAANSAPWKPSEMNHCDLVDATGEAISARLNDSSLRSLAVNLYGDTGKVGLLADIRNRRAEHVGHAALHDLRRRLGLSYDVRHIVDVPADHDAAVHLHPNGNGSLHTYTVPEDAEVVIVPAGARVVQGKPVSKASRKRTRLDVTRWTRLGFSLDDLTEMIEYGIWDAKTTSREFAGNSTDSPARILRLVDDWLAEDASIDPIVVSGEVAALLAWLD